MKHVFRILKEGRELWRQYLAVAILNVSLSFMTILTPIFSGWAIDEIQKGTNASIKYMVTLAIAIFVLDLTTTVISNVNGYIGDQLSIRLNKILSMRYFAHLMSLSQSYFDNELTGKIVGRLNRSIVQITGFIQMMSNNFLQFIFSTIVSLAAVAYYSWQVALMLFILYPIFVILTVKSSEKWQVYQKQKNEHFDIIGGRFAENVSQVKVVKSFVQEAKEKSFFDKHFNSVLKINKPQSAHWHKQDVRRRVILNVIFLGVYLFIFTQAAKGELTAGQAVALILHAMNIRLPIFTISWLVENTQRAVADSKDYFEVMNLKSEISDKTNAKEIGVTKGDIVFDNVDFSYNENQPVLKDISFEIKHGSKVALVGESGEGKTTLTNLILRLYEIDSGKITIDGVDIADATQSSVRKNIGVVFQDPSLFSGTIKENIAYSKPNATEEQIIKAAKAANAHEFVNALDKGYDTEIGERGLKLSGGQKQRIAIARALLKDAPILILDEATSSLDSKSEHLVQEALNRLMSGKTTIIIAHRLSTIASVDKIVTIRRSKIDEIGSPKELAETSGIYSELLQLQAGKSDKNKKKLKQFELEG
ncbi:MAG: ABC transporter ATP-binding protein [Candidatus Saccharibacteria bacterium]|nr:ABC transporter ATP-binding protein [Candidatus Saccharibacteria bacterium]